MREVAFEDATIKELKLLRRQLKTVARIHKYSLIQEPGKLMYFQFLLGMIRGFGSFLGATIVVALAYSVLGMLGYTDAFRQLLEIQKL